tara:strand:- start:691 stop:1140 length:450 start_codon:yes stop_codon:yes gene_type:complete
MTKDLSDYIEPIKGLSPFVKGTYIKVSSQFDIDKLQGLIRFLSKKNIDFAIYDEFYPSMSDPGAYISYSNLEKENTTKWKMTLGNHGWSGGIYEIDESTVLAQLKNLIKHNKLKEIKIVGVPFFRNYNLKDELASKKENELILTLHSNQ